MEFGWNALGSVFSQAGLRKNVEEDKWEFVKDEPLNSAEKRASINKDLPPPPEFPPDVTTPPPSVEFTDDTEKSSPKKKKNRGRKKRGMSQDLANSEKEKNENHISWGHVDEILFERGIGFDCIPSKGGYPLGLGEFVEVCTSSVDELFSRRQYLECLAANHAEAAIMSAQSVSGKKKSSAGKKTANSQRKDSFDKHSDHPITPEEMTADEIIQMMDAQVISEADRIRTLSNLTLHHHQNNHSNLHVSPVVLDEVNHEINSIRNSRQHIGCSCKPVKVDKMNVNQLKAKLHQFESQLPPNVGPIDKMKKADLLVHVKEFVKDCKQCIDNNCECVRLEISCAVFACDCMKGSPKDCHNTFNAGIFDPDETDVVRKQVLVELKAREALENAANTPATEEKSMVTPQTAGTKASRRKRSE